MFVIGSLQVHPLTCVVDVVCLITAPSKSSEARIGGFSRAYECIPCRSVVWNNYQAGNMFDVRNDMIGVVTFDVSLNFYVQE